MRVAAFALIAGLVAGSARAAIYENTITAETEEDLFEMQQRGDISEETADTLIELMSEGVDLNSASREQIYDLPGLSYAEVDAIIEYRTGKGRIDDPTELVGAGALTAEQLLQIIPFIRLDAARPVLPVSGKIHAQTRFTTTDNVAPPALLSARVKGPYNLQAGFMAFTTRRRAAPPVYDAVTDSLLSKGFFYSPQLPRFFVEWKPGHARLVAGTFTIGFGERLTLDNTRRVTPRGIYLIDDYRRPLDLSRTCKVSSDGIAADPATGCDPTTDKNLYISPDYSWREVFRGVAGSIEDLKLGDEASMSLYGFVSYQQRSIYQYQLWDRRYCEDPNDDTNDLCKAPPVYLEDRSSRLVYSTLNAAFDELAGGGHVTFKPSHRFTFGVTGFGALPIFSQSPMLLDFQEYSRYPTGGAFGALGLDGQASFKGFNFFIEATHNFDNRPSTRGAGGWGVEQRTTYDLKGQEFELSLRLYDPGFGTAYSRPIAGPDQELGQRARNEGGARFRWLGKFGKDWQLGVRANFWVNPWAIENVTTAGTTLISPAGVPNLFLQARVDFTGWSFFQPSVWVEMRNRNLPYSEHGTCDSETIVLTTGQPLTCGGDLYRTSARLEFAAKKRLFNATVQGSFVWRDDIRYRDRFRNDLQVWVEFKSMPVDWLQLRLRTRYWDQAIDDPTYLETNIWSFVEAAWRPFKGTSVALRYDLLYWLDQRSSTPNRIPNPEHRLQLDVRAAF